MPQPTRESLRADLQSLGTPPGGIVLVHSSFRAIGAADPETVFGALLDVLGPEGTLLVPALSYLQEPPDVHDARTTPTCVGYLAERFRTRPGVLRSLHPTHSVCGIGRQAEMLLADHAEDETPCGPCSPFRRLIEQGGSILMLGCGLAPNTTMHAIEELVQPPYLFGPRRLYTITDLRGRTWRKEYVTHGFAGYSQRYDRAAELLAPSEIRSGTVGAAKAYLMDAAALCECALGQMREDPFAFVEPIAPPRPPAR